MPINIMVDRDLSENVEDVICGEGKNPAIFWRDGGLATKNARDNKWYVRCRRTGVYMQVSMETSGLYDEIVKRSVSQKGNGRVRAEYTGH